MIIIAIFIVALILNPVRYMASASTGLKLFAASVLPALFPFFFFTRILTSLGAAHTLGISIRKPLKKIYNAPPITGYILIMSMLSGYPIGAKLVSECHSLQLMDYQDTQSASILCSTSGPLFILGTVGGVALMDRLAGVIILISHYIATLINACFYKSKSSKDDLEVAQLSTKSDNLLHDCIHQSIMAILLVGGYIVIFSMIIDILLDLGMQKVFVATLGVFGIGGDISLAVFASLMEVTRGAFMISALEIARIAKIAFLSGAVSFGGLCIGLQSLAFLSKCNVSPLKYFIAKVTQATLAVIIALLISVVVL